MKKMYAILVVNYFQCGDKELVNKLFATKEDAQNEAKQLAKKYIKDRKRIHRKDHHAGCPATRGLANRCLTN